MVSGIANNHHTMVCDNHANKRPTLAVQIWGIKAVRFEINICKHHQYVPYIYTSSREVNAIGIEVLTSSATDISNQANVRMHFNNRK